MPSFAVVSSELTEAEREQLESWSRRWTTAHALAQRSKVVLLVADGLRTGEVAERLGVHRNTVAKWRRRFEAERLEGLVDEPRPGQPRTIGDAKVDEVIAKTLESAPKDATHWSTRSMAAQVGGCPIFCV
jgi:transposase